ncbi:MAG: type II toxin-antitoxin system RelE/ParE family toxin [Methylocystis sp.]
MRVIFTPLAERQIDALHARISENAGEKTADAYIGLATFPERGQKRDDLLPGLRTIGFERRATIAFVVAEDAVLIEGVFYGGQDFEGIIGGP